MFLCSVRVVWSVIFLFLSPDVLLFELYAGCVNKLSFHFLCCGRHSSVVRAEVGEVDGGGAMYEKFRYIFSYYAAVMSALSAAIIHVAPPLRKNTQKQSKPGPILGFHATRVKPRFRRSSLCHF